MKPQRPLALFASLFGFITGPDSLSAQSVTSTAGERAIELSPFVVNSTKDTGYQATSTLAGTRLDTPLKDLGASISVYTKDFLDDIGATNSGDFLIYATNMEASGPGGNGALTASGAGNDLTPGNLLSTNQFPESARENPQGTSRSRGLFAPTFTRDFFVSGIDIDSYNTDRVTVLRGPNSALFGVSSPAGVTDTSLVRADTARNKNRVAFRYGNNGSIRSTVDFNRVLLPDKLAVRLTGLQMREEYNQRPAFESKERIFGALTYRPFPLTSLRANFESGRMWANRPNMILPVDAVPNEWYALGRPTHDWAFYDDPARNPLAATQNASAFYPYYMANSPYGAMVFVYNQPDDQKISYAMRWNTPTTTGNTANSIRAQLLHPLLNRDLANDTVQFSSTRNIFDFAPAAFWIGGNVLPGQLPGLSPAGIKYQGFTDLDDFDHKNRMLDETGSYTDNFHSSNFILEQRAWDNRVGIELAYDNQRLDRRSLTTFFNGNNSFNGHIRIDTTVTLPNGLPNPNLGRPFSTVGQGIRWTEVFTLDETKRVNAYLKYDFKDLGEGWARSLGRHTLNGVLERYRRDRINLIPQSRVDGPVAIEVSPIINLNRAPTYVVYHGPSLVGNNNPLKLDPIKARMPISGPLGQISSFTRAANATDLGSFTDSPASLTQAAQFGQVTREVIESRAATLQSYWLQDHLVTMFGWRRDTDYFGSQVATYVTNPNNLNDPGKVKWGFNDLSFANTPPLNVAKETKSYSIVVRWPQKLVPLPRGTDLSFFYNDAENFTPSAGRITGYGGPLPVPEGTTEEYGFTLSAFNDKLTFRANRFETRNSNVSLSSGFVTNLVVETYLRWAVEGNINPQLVAMRQADIAKLLSVVPANYLQLYNATVTGVAPNIVGSRNSNLPGATDTQDFVAKGLEFELTYNPTPNWRILANVAHQEVVRSNLIPFGKKVMAELTPIIAQLANVPANNYPTGWTPGTPLPATTELFGTFVDRTVSVPLATALAAEGFPSPEQRPWRFNLVTNYSFRQGSIFGDRLRGWSIGGGVRWQSEFTMGYPSVRNPDTSIRFVLAQPYHAPTELNVDGFVSYTRRIWDNRIDWKMQINAMNLYTPRELIPITAQPWGQPAAMRLAPEQRWYVTNTFSF